MEYEIEQVDSDDYCTISADDDYFVQFCNPPLPSFVADNATIGKFLSCLRDNIYDSWFNDS